MGALDDAALRTGRRISPGGTTLNVVLETPEFRRIRDMARRDWTLEDAAERVAVLTQAFRSERGTQTLKLSQAAALVELADLLGLFAPIRVGGGKTLVTLLAATILLEARPELAERALLLVPAGLIEKTRREAREYAKHWKIRPLTIESYEMLSRDYSGRILEGLRPTLIMADEAQRLKNTQSGCWKRLKRYVNDTRKRNEKAGMPWPHGVVFVALSGSMTTKSLREYWHLIRMALGEGAPLPTDVDEFQQWSLALDERVSPESRWQPDVFVRLSPGFEITDEQHAKMNAMERAEARLVRARQAYQSRLISTPGVISTKEDIPPMALNLRATHLEAPPVIRDAIATMRSTYCTPDGHPFEMPLELWRHARELQCGFYQVWDPRPPEEWLFARMNWHSYVRNYLKRARKVATPGEIVRLIEAGEWDDPDGARIWHEWAMMKPTFTPNSVPYWVDDTTLRYCADWLNTGKTAKKLCWVEHVAAGLKLSQLTGIPYFGEEGRDVRGNTIDTHKGAAIVSVRSCSTGRNLQAWDDNQYMSPMSKNDQWEQSMGRTHRDGQESDEVSVEVLMMCREAYSSLTYAIREAEYTTQTMGQPQKLVYCTRDLGSVEALISRRSDELWKGETDGV